MSKRDFFEGPHGRPDRKAQQLCREVERTLSYALSSSADAILRDLTLVSVEPAPDVARLMVTVYANGEARTLVGEIIVEHLQAQKGELRGEIASALQRKRTPELVFRVVYPPSSDEMDSW